MILTMKIKNFKLNLLNILGIFILTGCSSFIYYPDRYLYVNPKALKHVPTEVLLEAPNLPVLLGWEFHPSKKKGPKRCIAYFHGNGQNRSSHIAQIFWIIDRGFHLYTFDYPGYGQTGGEPTPENTVSAAVHVLKYVKKQKCDQNIFYGHSLGGQVLMRATWELRTTFKPDVLITDSTFLSYKKTGNRILRKSWFTWLFSPLSYLVLSDEWAMGDKIKDLNDYNLVVIHTKTDQVIDFELGKEIFNKATTPNKQFWVKELGDHNYIYGGEEGKKLKEKLVKYLMSF